MIKKSLLIIMLIGIFLSFYISIDEVSNHINNYSENYFITNTLEETGSANIVTGIYLDYRLFDSIFEASILLITVSGIIFMSKKDNGVKNSDYLAISSIERSNSLESSLILATIGKILYIFMLIYGIYIIIYGHLSPGGGFQGGVILATGILITYLFKPINPGNLDRLVQYEKLSFMIILLISSLSVFSKGYLFTSFVDIGASIKLKGIYLILLNLFIGIKVSLGLIGIFSTFLNEGRS